MTDFKVIDHAWLHKLWNTLNEQHPLAPGPERFDYDSDMDEECIKLCDALNCIPGIKTYESCCGHGTSPFSIWMTAESIEALYVIARCVDTRYGGPYQGDWTLKVEDTDTQDMPVIFHLHSPIVTPPNGGAGRYDLPTICNQADTIALHIHDTLKMMAQSPP